MTARTIVIGSLCLAWACSEPEMSEHQDELVGTRPAVWAWASQEFCGDLCPGDPLCTCVQLPQPPCSTTFPAGQSCSTPSSTCVVLGSPHNYYTEYRCDAPPMYYRIANARSGLCLHVGSSSNGAAVVQAVCNGSAAQDWQVETPASASSRIRNRSTNKCLDIVNDLAVQNPCDARASEKFQPESSTRNVMLVRSNASSFSACLDIPFGSMSPSVQAKHFQCKNPTVAWFAGLDDASNQLWVFLPNS